MSVSDETKEIEIEAVKWTSVIMGMDVQKMIHDGIANKEEIINYYLEFKHKFKY